MTLRHVEHDEWGELTTAERKKRALAAVEELHAEQLDDRKDYDPLLVHYRGIRAQSVAYRLRIEQARRHGNGAVKGSWSGYMPAALRCAKTLEALARDGKLTRHVHDYVAYYVPAEWSRYG